jgi:hypothetical protein
MTGISEAMAEHAIAIRLGRDRLEHRSRDDDSAYRRITRRQTLRDRHHVRFNPEGLSPIRRASGSSKVRLAPKGVLGGADAKPDGGLEASINATVLGFQIYPRARRSIW